MIIQNRENSEIKGDKKIIFCEFSTLIYSLLSGKILTEEEIDEAVNNAKEYIEKFETKIDNELDNELDELAEQLANVILGGLSNNNNKDIKASDKYKVGDKVIVRSDLEQGRRYGDNTFVGDNMEKLKGKKCEIERIDYIDSMDIYMYRLKECYGGYWWTDEMFEQTNDKNKKKTRRGRPKKLRKDKE